MNAKDKILYVGNAARPVALDLVLEGQGYKIWEAKNAMQALNLLADVDFEAMVVEERELLNVEEWWWVKALHPKLPVLRIREVRQ